MRVCLALALSLASFLLAGAAELNMRDPLAYPNMLSAPLGKSQARLIAVAIAQTVSEDHPPAVFGRERATTPCLSANATALFTGYNPRQSGALRQGRIPKRYIVRMKRHSGTDLDSAIIRCGLEHRQVWLRNACCCARQSRSNYTSWVTLFEYASSPPVDHGQRRAQAAHGLTSCLLPCVTPQGC